MRAMTRLGKRESSRVSDHVLLLLLGAMALGLFIADARAQSGGDFEIRRSTIDAGGGRSTGSNLQLIGTIGQPDAGLATGGTFELRGGFWAAATPAGATDVVFSDGFE
jgi:hypothetical protein